MKKLFAFLAVVLAVVSCQKDADLNVNVGGEQLVNITVALPEATRADSAQSGWANTGNELRVILQIFDENGNTTDTMRFDDEKLTYGNTTVNYNVRLVPGHKYTFVAWADQGTEGQYFNTSNLKNVTFVDGVWTAMNENIDAYTDTETVEAGNSIRSINLVLTRPFAKVRVVATDINAVLAQGWTPTAAVATYQETVPVSFNAFAGVVGETAPVVNPVRHVAYNDQYDDNAGEMTLFADYLYVPTSGTAKFEFAINGVDNNRNAIVIRNDIVFNTPIPAVRNKLTTIKGNILTDGSNIKVEVDEEFDEPENIVKVATTADDLQTMINNATDGEETNISLGGNINLNDLFKAGVLSTRAGESAGLVIPAKKTVVLDLNGYTLSQEKECSAHYSMIENHGNLTITGNGTISFKDTGAGDPNFGWGSYTISTRAGTLVVENGTIEHIGEQNQGNGTPNCHMYCAIWQYDGSTIINGGKISTPTYRSARLWQGDMTINGGEFDGQLWLQAINNNANLTINGGTFSPNGNDGSSVFVSNIDTSGVKHNVAVSVTGGHFTTKIGMSEPFACITGGTFTAEAKEGTNTALINDDYAWTEAENGNWTLTRKPNVAMIGEVGYTTLAKAVAAVEDGGTITLVADEVFTETNRYNNGGWWDGLGYSGDKSFTIDLNSKTIRQDGALNDYLIWVKNDGAKANTITLKNGTLDAGTTAYCAFATASSNAQKITINFENVNLVGNNSNGAVAKIRGGAELNVKAGTVITGNNNYVGIEAVGNNTVVNIYDDVNIYQNGTGSYVGAIVGASYNATMNIYGGYGKSAKCGIIVMSTGATINVSGGEWIANNDGTVAAGNNGVLVSQNNRNEKGWACKSILNVTGGTFKGGYDCWGMGPGVEPDDAQINIKGGNFNADPASYVVAGYESVEENDIYTVAKPKALADFEAAIAKGGNVTLASDVTLLETINVKNEVVIDLNGKTVTAPLFSAFNSLAGGNLTIKNGKVVAYESTVRAIGGKAVIESGEYTSTGTALDSPATYRYSLDCREGGELIINGGTFKSNNGMINVGSTVTINGGKFENVVEKSMTRHFAYVSAPLTINDGEFYGKANGAAGGCFFCGAASGCDIQVNGGKFTSLWTSGSVNRIFEVYYGGKINVTGGMFNTNGGIATFVTENTDEATKAEYPYVAK